MSSAVGSKAHMYNVYMGIYRSYQKSWMGCFFVEMGWNSLQKMFLTFYPNYNLKNEPYSRKVVFTVFEQEFVQVWVIIEGF